MTLHYHAAGSLDARRSLVGRLISWRITDKRKAEGVFLFTVVGILMLLVLANVVAWIFLQDWFLLNQDVATKRFIGLVQVGILGVVGGVSLLGFKPALHVSLDAELLKIQQGNHQEELPLSAIRECRIVTPKDVHRHYARFGRTQLFSGKQAESYLLIRSDSGPYVIALNDKVQAFHRIISTYRSTDPVTVPNPAV